MSTDESEFASDEAMFGPQDADLGSIFDTFATRDEFAGFGYIGGRRNALDTSDPEAIIDPVWVAQVDRFVLDYAASQGWTEADLFAWANSKLGRWFADSTLFGGLGGATRAMRDGSLLRLP